MFGIVIGFQHSGGRVQSALTGVVTLPPFTLSALPNFRFGIMVLFVNLIFFTVFFFFIGIY